MNILTGVLVFAVLRFALFWSVVIVEVWLFDEGVA